MKVGDLVELSSYGKRLVMMKNYVGDVGVIRKTARATSYPFSGIEYHILWSKNGYHPGHLHFLRKDLKHATKRNKIR